MNTTANTETGIIKQTIYLDKLDLSLRVGSEGVEGSKEPPSKNIMKAQSRNVDDPNSIKIRESYQTAQIIVKGFTPGAVKNIFSFSGSVNQLSVFSVTENSINLVSKSKLKTGFDGRGGKVEETFLLFNEERCTLTTYFDFAQNAQIFKLNKKTGRIETETQISRSLISRFDDHIEITGFFTKTLEGTGGEEIGTFFQFATNKRLECPCYLFSFKGSRLRPWMALRISEKLLDSHRELFGIKSQKKAQETGEQRDHTNQASPLPGEPDGDFVGDQFLPGVIHEDPL